MNICDTGKDFQFESLTLAQPNGLQGGSYFTRLMLNDNPVYIQAPACQTKQGIVTNGKKSYCDLMFTGDNEEILDWFENLEKTLIDKIYEKRNLWFHNSLEKEDIENAFTSLMRVYKSGRFYLVRVNLAKNKSSSQKPFTCFDDQENPVDPEIIKDQDVKVIPLLEFLGVKFSSKSFQIEVCLRQLMVLNEKEMFNTCLIKKSSKNDDERQDSSVNTDESSSEGSPISPVDLGSIEVKVPEVNDDVGEATLETNVLVNDKPEDVDINTESVKEVQSKSPSPEPNVESKSPSPEPNVESKINLVDVTNDLEEVKVEKDNSLEEINFDIENLEEEDTISLKKPNEVYFEIWREARLAAKQARKQALQAYLNAKNIKATYMLDEIDDDSSDEFDNYLDSLSEKEVASVV
jgi:hypothetical protein